VNPELDSSLNANGERLARNTRLVLPAESGNEIGIARRVSDKFSQTGDQQLIILSVKRRFEAAGKGFQCFEPYLMVLSLGIIPSVCSQEYTFELEWQNKEGERKKNEVLVEEKLIGGWVALFIALLPTWHYGYDSGRVINSVIFTEVNRRASQ